MIWDNVLHIWSHRHDEAVIFKLLANSLWPSDAIWWHRFDGINYQAITWTSEDFSSKVFCGIHLRAISQEMLINFTCNMCLEIALKFFNHYHISQGLMSLYILNEAKKIGVWHLLHIFGGHCIKIHNSTLRLYSTHWMRTCN